VVDVREQRMVVHLGECGAGVAMARGVVTATTRLRDTTWPATMQACSMDQTRYLVVTVPLRSRVDISRLLSMRTLAQFVTVAAQQVVFLNPRGTTAESSTRMLFAGAGALPHQQPSVGLEFLLPCRPGTSDPNPTATPLGDKLLRQCIETLRSLRDGARRVARMSTCTTPALSGDAPVPAACAAVWKRVVSRSSAVPPPGGTGGPSKLRALVGAKACSRVLSAIIYLSETMAVKPLPGPQFTSPVLTVGEAAGAMAYAQASKSLKIETCCNARNPRVLVTEVVITVPFFSAVALGALESLVTSLQEDMAVRVDGMTGTLQCIITFRLSVPEGGAGTSTGTGTGTCTEGAGRATKRQRV
jgi:hypothetical protein